MSLRKRQMSLALPLLVAPFPLPTAPLPLRSKTLLCQSTAAHLCLPVLAPGHWPAQQSPRASRLGPFLLVCGPFLSVLEEGATRPQARPWKRAEIKKMGLEEGAVVHGLNTSDGRQDHGNTHS
ncbi:UNVERIFIED_CONTAM: hypothetical protein FKN15_005720 [Acipenser sinensis]